MTGLILFTLIFRTTKSKEEIRNSVDYSIKWSRAVKNDLAKGKIYCYDKHLFVESLYRPYVKKKLYFSKELNEIIFTVPKIERAMDLNSLNNIAEELNFNSIKLFQEPEDAFNYCIDANKPILIIGSFYLAGEILPLLKKILN